jgi:hypothetical protein
MGSGIMKTQLNYEIHFYVLGSIVYGYSSSELDVSENSIIPLETSGSFFLPLILCLGDSARQSISLVGLAGNI